MFQEFLGNSSLSKETYFSDKYAVSMSFCLSLFLTKVV